MFSGRKVAPLLCRTKVANFSQVPAVHQSISGRTRFYKHVDVIPTPDGKAGQVGSFHNFSHQKPCSLLITVMFSSQLLWTEEC